MGVALETVQFKFSSIVEELCNEPDVLFQFAVWLDLRLAEYKLKGAISLDCSGEELDCSWMNDMRKCKRCDTDRQTGRHGSLSSRRLVRDEKPYSSVSLSSYSPDWTIIKTEPQETFSSELLRTSNTMRSLSRKRPSSRGQQLENSDMSPSKRQFFTSRNLSVANQSLLSLISDEHDINAPVDFETNNQNDKVILSSEEFVLESNNSTTNGQGTSVDLSSESSGQKDKNGEEINQDVSQEGATCVLVQVATVDQDFFDNLTENNEIFKAPVEEASTSANLKKLEAPTKRFSRHATVSSSSGTGICVLGTNNGVSRSWDRRCYCHYCGKYLAKLMRHLSSAHKEETEVVRITCQNDQKKKNALITQLRNLGNHKHNCEVLREGKGEIIVSYRPRVDVPPEDYVPCEFCLGYYSRPTLWLHVRRCSASPSSNQNRKSSVATGSLLLPVPKGTSAKLNSVLSTLRLDNISRIIKGDPLILTLGEKLLLKTGTDKYQQSLTCMRNSLREVGRLLRQLREQQNAPDANLEEYIDPIRFQDVVNAARVESGFCDITQEFSTPSLALKLGHSLKRCAKLIRGRCIRTGEERQQKMAERILDLLETKWTDETSSHALRTRYQNKRNKEIEGEPSSGDSDTEEDSLTDDDTNTQPSPEDTAPVKTKETKNRKVKK